MSESLVRGVAGLAALVLVCAPAVPVVVAWVRANQERIRKGLSGWPHVALAFALAYVAAFGVPRLPAVNGVPEVPALVVPTPSPAMQTAVADVHKALAGANPVDRAVWAQLWTKAGVVVAGDATDTEIVFTDTRSLRAYTVLAIRIGWRRLGENAAGKYAGLNEATERAFSGVLGIDVQPVTPELRARYIELCNALAWCGAGRG
jgi:hypothetical protein